MYPFKTHNKFKKLAAIFVAASLSCVSVAQAPYLEWAKSHETGSSWGYSISTDIDNNVYTTGVFHGSLIVETVSGIDTVTSPTAADNCFVQKTDSEGNIIWIKGVIGIGTSESVGNSVVVDSAGNVYVAGAYSGTADFDPGPNELLYNTSAVSEIYVLKLDSAGELVWVKNMPGNAAAYGSMAKAITLDYQNNLLITGDYYGTVDFDPGPAAATPPPGCSVYIQKLDTAGNLIWVKTINPTEAKAIDSDQEGNVYVTGAIIGTADFDPGAGVFSYASTTIEYADIFTLKLDQNGDFKWANCSGGNTSDVGIDVVVDNAGNVYTLGTFLGSVDFHPGPEIVIQTANGNQDTFISKVDSLGNFLWVKTLWGEFSSVISKSMVTDSSCNLHLCGYYYGGVDVDGKIDLDPGTGESNHTSNGFSDLFIEKLDSAGNFIWGTSIGGISGDLAEGIALDNENHVYITGRFTQTVNFNPNGTSFDLTGTGFTAFTAKYKEGYVNLNEVKTANGISVYPNPTTGEQWLVIHCAESTKAKIDLLDINGRLIQNIYEGQLDESNSAFSVSFSALPDGIYFYSVILDDGTAYYQRIVKN